MNLNRVPVLFILILGFSLLSFGQDNVITYDLKKGEAFDILLLTTKKGTKEIFKEYRQKAFPVAAEMGYSQLPGFRISQMVQGDYDAKGMVLGKWTSIPLREKFLDVIETRVPNFHDMREKLWSPFNLTYYEVPQDYSFQLDMDKVVVATAYWKKNDTQAKFDAFLNQWKKAVAKTNGTIKIELVNGKSPKGYEYNPDYMVIAQWNTQEDFEAFQRKNLNMDTGFLKNVNQFLLDK